jgi:cysteine-rich repeat protein
VRWTIVVAVLLGACIEPGTPHCGTLICPADKVCDENRVECVLPGQRSACDGMADGTPCTFPGEDDGVCDHGTCFTSVCGDGLIGAHEVCDDVNSIDGDGCSARCLSDEKCGNSIVDVAIDESCDDGNLLSGDGCSSGCAAEVASWHEVDLDPYPGAFGMAATFDVARGKVVMFGGLSPTLDPVRDTWELDGQEWTRPLHGAIPPGRDGHVLAYDAARRAVVLFGGSGGMMGPLGDLWTYDGRWTELATAGGPSPRAGVAGAYDAATKKLVIFGGETAGGLSGETWELSGTTWTRSATTGPTARRDHLMAYDAARDRIVLYGGKAGATQLTDTWEWTGSAWTPVTTATTLPSARGAMVYDADRARTVLFGGFDAVAGTTWEYDGTDWTEVTGAAPATRRRPGMVYDPLLHAVVLRGGTQRTLGAAGPPLDDTWRYDGAWTQDLAVEPHAPAPRNFAGFAWDPMRQRFVLAAGFAPPGVHLGETWTYDGEQWTQEITEPGLASCGGAGGACGARMAWDPIGQRMLLVRNAGAMMLETWSYDGRTWTKLAPSGAPPGREAFALAYDTKRNKLVLFGGEGMMGALAETWELSGNAWTRVMTPMSPPGRAEAAMTYDSARGAIVVFGGRTAGMMGMPMTDTWLYDGTTWKRLETPHAPSARFGAALAFHVARGDSILFGGDGMMGPLSDTWELGPTDWIQLNAFEGPGPRKSPHLAYDPARKVVVLFGGDPQNDTWELLYRSTLADEQCEVAGDEDGDGLAECADPDCDGAVCGEADHVCTAGACACVGSAEIRCDDGFDDDCDGAIDCADSECAGIAPCQVETSCDNAADDDGDGRADCADPGCAGTGTCELYETRCTDGLDNDGDTLADCRDPDCFLAGCSELLP